MKEHWRLRDRFRFCMKPNCRSSRLRGIKDRFVRVLLFTVTGCSFSLSAMGADLPARMEPVAPIAYVPAFSWSGFYLGGELGWIQTNPEYSTGALLLGAPFLVTSGSDKNGLTYGILGGYNYQMGQLVVGIEADFQGWTVGEIRYTAITGDFLTAHSKWGGSIRGRLGYAADRALLYVTGGAAFVSNETSIPFTGISIGGEDTRVGWTAGAGLDYAFTNNWFTGLEYRYSQYQAKSFVYPIPILGLGLVGFKQELSNNQVTARVGYKF
ncbi:outer membrane protein [Bradyrhizobium sp. AUGA SZCCT0431]|uniref:outer membrane protein n=1 Tax=Bradyrhizobium sp. AUGA SZCCT0431 TaxID=2807674 RepID=UPI001BAD6061|nr:outer membrane protein [Bradyrhizobium sp. AUGA SZCCT0431]MBR1148150.1 porin family protein [Bradyrhizobium sp. AUGA SZCCT0431]